MIGGTLLLLVAWAVLPRLRGQSAAERHLYWAASLGAATLMPLLGVLLPPWRPGWAGALAAVLPSALDTGQRWAATDRVDVVVRAVGVERAAWTPADVWPWLWGAGAAIALLQLVFEAAALRRLAAEAPPMSDDRAARLVDNVARALRLRRPIRLLQSPGGAVPFTWGMLRPTVMLPASAGAWSDDRAHAVLAHELAHVRRHDWVVHVLADLSCRFFWFHPLFWVARHRLWAESERAADDLVLGLGVESGDYATHLLAIVRAARSGIAEWSPTVAMARRSLLEGRFAALLNARARRRAATRGKVAIAATVALLIAVPLASMSLLHGATGIEIKMINLPAIVEPAAMAEQEPPAPPVRNVRVGDGTSETDLGTPPAIAEYTTPPLYSDEARSRGIEGLVTISVHIEADGHVSGARVLRGLGFGLDQNALVALRQWRFRPGTRAGSPVATSAEIDVEFSLRNEAVNAVVANDMATRVGPGITPPRAVRAFGLWGRRSTRSGTVVLDVVLQEDGTPRIVRILHSLDPELDEGAVRNFSQWRFSPAMKNGRPVKVRLNAEVTFHG
jgi:TonB family protein